MKVGHNEVFLKPKAKIQIKKNCSKRKTFNNKPSKNGSEVDFQLQTETVP